MIPIPGNLRVNADDFGLSPSVSRAITAAAEAGLINSISVTPFSDAQTASRLRAVAARPELRIGAHLTFLEVPFLTKPPGFSDGPPSDYRAFLRAYLRGKIAPAAVYQEWRAQIQLLRERLGGRTLSHLDSHQHVHVLPGLWVVGRRLQGEFSIPRLRVPWEGTGHAARKNFPFGLALQTLAWLRRHGADEHFFGVGASLHFTAAAFQSFAQRVAQNPQQNFELMIHPDENPRGQFELAELRRWLEMLAEEKSRHS